MAPTVEVRNLRNPLSFQSPTKEHSQELLHRVILPGILQQEHLHALSKRPIARCAVEADLKIQAILSTTNDNRGRVLGLEKQFQILESKVDKLELERENGQKHHMIHQLSFSTVSPPPTPSPIGTGLGKRTTPPRRAKLNLQASSVMMSPSSPEYSMSPQVIEYLRKRKLLEMCLNKMHSKLKGEVQGLQQLFESNFKLLKFRRAESCVLTMIKLQRKLKGFENNVCQLKDRLLHIG